MVKIDESIDAEDKSASERFLHCKCLRAVHWQIGHRPDDRVDTLLNVQGYGYHTTGVPSHSNTTANIISPLLIDTVLVTDINRLHFQSNTILIC